MRTDVKIGLVSVLALVLIVVAYVVFAHRHTSQVSEDQIASPQPQLVSATEPATLPAAQPQIASPSNQPGAAVPGIVMPPTTLPATPSTLPAAGQLAANTTPTNIGPTDNSLGGSSANGGAAGDNGLAGSPADQSSGNGDNSLGSTSGSDSGLTGGSSSNSLNTNNNQTNSGTDSATSGLNSASGQAAGGSYTVRSHDTLAGISKRIYGSARMVRAIERANPGLDPRRMRVGQKIHLPAGGHASHEAQTTRHHHLVASSHRGRAASHHYYHRTAGHIYVVRHGDTLTAIARQIYHSGADWRLIYRANRRLIGSHPSNLRVGEHLVIPAKH